MTISKNDLWSCRKKDAQQKCPMSTLKMATKKTEIFPYRNNNDSKRIFYG